MDFETLRSKLKSQTSSPLCTKEESDKCDEAQTAQKGGLPYYEALKSLTVNAAEILGIGDEVGTISVGKSADLQFYPLNMCPLDLMAEPVMVMIDGRIVKTK